MDISVVLSTFNRSGLLRRALEKLAGQQAPGIKYEVLVVDNNSTDDTHEVIEEFVGRDERFRYVFEPRQGLSYGRNAGIAEAQADAIVFTDDDVEAAPDWVAQVHAALERYADADFIGGRVLAVRDWNLPRWAHARMAPFALQDWGDEAITVSAENRRCLIGACLAARRRAFAKAGLFRTETQRVKDGVGSTEDADWEAQVWERGGTGVYDPRMVVYADVAAQRLQRRYHWRWHLGHGRFNAKGRRAEYRAGRPLMDVPVWLYRRAGEDAIASVRLRLSRRPSEAFDREARVLFAIGFIASRWKARVFTGAAAKRAREAEPLAG